MESRAKDFKSLQVERILYSVQFVPEQAQENMPLIVYLHGDSEVNKIDEVADIEMVKRAKEIYGEDFPFLVLAPNTPKKSWVEGWIYNITFDLIESIAQEYKVDPEKIILTGHSRGAIGTWYYINMNYYYPSFETDITFSCALPISHYAAYSINPELSAKLPIWAICGDADAVEKECVEKLTENIDQVVAAGGNATMTVLEGHTHGQTEGTAYTKEVFEWMLAQ
jgi:predicted peptidase